MLAEPLWNILLAEETKMVSTGQRFIKRRSKTEFNIANAGFIKSIGLA